MSNNQNNDKYTSHSGYEKIVNLCNLTPPIRCIGAKAFLSCKHVEKLILPSTLSSIEDWGFAHMKNLKEICFPTNDITLGKQVFLGLDKLEKVSFFCDDEEVSVLPGMEEFIASELLFFAEQSSLNFASLSTRDGQLCYLNKYDIKLVEYINSPDDSSYIPAFIGWFDVRDLDDQKSDYMKKIRLEKIMLAFKRLDKSTALSEFTLHSLNDYLTEQSDFILSLILNGSFPLTNDPRFFVVWINSGGLSQNMATTLIKHSIPDDTEIRKRLIEFGYKDNSESSVFDSLSFNF